MRIGTVWLPYEYQNLTEARPCSEKCVEYFPDGPAVSYAIREVFKSVSHASLPRSSALPLSGLPGVVPALVLLQPEESTRRDLAARTAASTCTAFGCVSVSEHFM